MEGNGIKGYRLSPQQKHLWWLQGNNSHNAFYAQCAVRIEGNLEPRILQEALCSVINRHEILRSTFPVLPGAISPLQVIADTLPPAVHETDLSHQEESEQEARIEALFREMKDMPVALDEGSPARMSLVTLSPSRHVLLIKLLAFCADIAALENLVGEIGRSYEACLRDVKLLDDPIQYADLSEILNELLESEETEAGREYWRKQDFSSLSPAALPFSSRIDLAQAVFRPQLLSCQVDAKVYAALRSLAQTSGVSTSTCLLACWCTLLWRLGAQSEFIVGTAYAGRSYAELESAIGLFARYLPLRCRMKPDITFSQLLEQISSASGELAEWQDYFSWSQSVAAAGAMHRPAAAYFPICFDFHARPRVSEVAGLRLSIARSEVLLNRFQLKLSGVEQAEGLRLDFHFDGSLMKVADVERLTEELQTLLRNVTAEPHMAISSYEILGAGEHQLLLRDFNRTQTPGPASDCVHDLFAEQAAKTPDRIALVDGVRQISYAELNRKANQLAHYLRARGAGQEALVGLYLERSIELMVGLLAIIKAGAAYVPLDPSQPWPRMAQMLKDARSVLLVTRRELGEKLADVCSGMIYVDAEAGRIANEQESEPDSGVVAANLVYVMYTSGSTGTPKGVMVTHEGLVNYLRWSRAAYDATRGCGTPVHSSIGFDLTITSLLVPLMCGQRVVLLSEEEGLGQLSKALAEGHDWTLVKLTPGHLEVLKQMLEGQTLEGRANVLVIGGEALMTESLLGWREDAPSTRLVNEYGPTEAVVGCCVYEVDPNAELSGPVPIGRPIANMEMYVLNEKMRAVPVGVVGELYIGGRGIARGYFEQPESTAEKFVPHPYSERAGERLYRTGDLGRHLANGQLEYVGRTDQQVKIRGFRVELGEIEAALRDQEGVREAVVLVKESSGEKHLIGHVVAESATALEVEARDGNSEFSAILDGGRLRQNLMERLPEYMVPARVVVIQEMPLTGNGKIDRRALAEIGEHKERLEREKSYVGPRTQTEELLAKIWSQVLKVERVGVFDNLFELGGDSIMGIRIINRANQAGLRLTPNQLFQYQTIAELATVAETAPGVIAEQGPVTGPVNLIPVQHWFFEQSLPNPHHCNLSMLIEVHQVLDPCLLEKTVQHLVTHHDALRLRFLRKESGWEQVSTGLDTATPFSVIDLSELQEAEQGNVIEMAAAALQSSLHLSEGPLLRVVHLDLGAQRPSRLLLIIHHMAMDGVSWRILLEDLQMAYQQLRLAGSVKLPSKTTSFKEWAERLKDYAQTAELRQELDFWRNASSQYASRLPVDIQGGSNTEGSARSLSVALGLEDTRALLQDVPAVFLTRIDDVLLTALLQTHTRWTGTSSLLLELEGHGRGEVSADVDLSRTVGCFTTIFPVLLELKGNATPVEALKSVKEQLRQIPHRGIGYGLLRYLSDDRQIAEVLRNLPQPQIGFNNLGQIDQSLPEFGEFGFARESLGALRDPLGIRRRLIDVVASVSGGQLHILWTYGGQLFHRATIEALARRYVEALRQLIAHCIAPEAGGFTPSDFPLAKLNQQQLDKIINRAGITKGMSSK
jgi:amino acid adenylation domain-containing protein/non-ribosomal peptide synthase protein (TIGR01720 family)